MTKSRLQIPRPRLYEWKECSQCGRRAPLSAKGWSGSFCPVCKKGV